MPLDVHADLAAPAMHLGCSASMHRVIDRPDRRLSFFTRLRGYYRRMRVNSGVSCSMVKLFLEWLRAQRIDVSEHLSRKPRVTRVLPGSDALAPSRSIAIYVHFAPTPTVGPMVIAQLRSYRALGFRILFVSMAPPLTAPVLGEVADLVALIVQRRNIGLDFGAWQDMLPFLDPGPTGPLELLLVNDSVCGPLRPLEPILADMRRQGCGFYGMTESLAPSPHLQSYFLLARGEAAISDVTDFLTSYRQTNYKRDVVRRGEIALTDWMRARGNAVYARFGYQHVEAVALRSSIARDRLRCMFPHLFAGIEDHAAGFALRLLCHPLNPAHSLWRELVEICGFPFLKTELLLRNPIGISDLDRWRLLPQPPQTCSSIDAHLALMGHGRKDHP